MRADVMRAEAMRADCAGAEVDASASVFDIRICREGKPRFGGNFEDDSEFLWVASLLAIIVTSGNSGRKPKWSPPPWLERDATSSSRTRGRFLRGYNLTIEFRPCARLGRAAPAT
eukprot:1195541-Prorocentrum_minimum.AAC.4